MEILDAPAPESAQNPLLGSGAVRESPYTAWVNIQTGCDNSCAFCIVPSVRGPEVSRPFEEIVAEVELLARRGVSEVTLLGQNVNSYGRDLTKRRPLFAALLRAVGAVAGIGRVRFTSPHPKDLRPETIEAMAETPEVCEQLHLPSSPAVTGCCAPCGGGTRAQRYLERLRAARAAIDDLAVTTDIIVGFPGETEADFEDTLALCAEAAYDSAFTFIFSPRPGTRAAAMEERIRPGRSGGRAVRSAQDGDRPIGSGPPPVPGGTPRGGARRGREPPRQRHALGAHPTGQAGPLPRRAISHGDPEGTPAAGCPGRGDHHRGPSPPPLGPTPRGAGAPAAPRADPGGQRLSVVALVGVTASGKSDAALEVAERRGDCEIVSVDSMCVYRGMDIGTSKPGPAARRAVPHHLLDLVDPDEDFTVTRFQDEAREALGRHREPGPPRPPRRRDRAVPPCRDRRPALPRPLPRGGRRARGRARRRRASAADLHARLAALDPVGAARMEPTNRRRVVRALEVTLGSGRPFSEFGPGLEAYPADGHRPGRPGAIDAGDSIGASPRASPPWWRPAWSTRCRLWRRVRPGSRGRRARRWATARCWPTWRTAPRSRTVSTRRCAALASSPGARPSGSAVIRASPGRRSGGVEAARATLTLREAVASPGRARLRRGTGAGERGRDAPTLRRRTKHEGAGNDFLVAARSRRRGAALRRPGAPPGRPPPGHGRRRDHPGRTRAATAATSPWSCATRTGERPR